MLQGSFETFDFAEVLGMLARKAQTGKLRLHSGSSIVDVYLDNGRLTHTEMADHGAAMQVADTRARLGEACFEVLRWDHGSFEFHPSVVPPASRQLDAPVEEVIATARELLEEWVHIEAIVPNLEVQPSLARELSTDEVTIDRQAWTLLIAIDGRRNGQALGRMLGLSPYETGRLLARMVRDGLVDLNTNRPKVTVSAPTRGTSITPGVRVPGRGIVRTGPMTPAGAPVEPEPAAPHGPDTVAPEGPEKGGPLSPAEARDQPKAHIPRSPAE